MKSAFEEWKALNRAVNCKHYIGPRRWAAINDALESMDQPAEEDVVEPEQVAEPEDQSAPTAADIAKAALQADDKEVND